MTTAEDKATARAWLIGANHHGCRMTHGSGGGEVPAYPREDEMPLVTADVESLAELLAAERTKAWNEAIDKAYDVLNELTDAFVKEESVDRYNVAADAGARVRALRRPT